MISFFVVLDLINFQDSLFVSVVNANELHEFVLVHSDFFCSTKVLLKVQYFYFFTH